MPAFPLLKTGAVTQYPLECTLRNQTQRVWFLDGTTQQYRIIKPLRRWKINLSQIDERELDRVIDFVEQQEGSAFSFPDPFTGDSVSNCVIGGQGLEADAHGELQNTAVLVIEEVA